MQTREAGRGDLYMYTSPLEKHVVQVLLVGTVKSDPDPQADMPPRRG